MKDKELIQKAVECHEKYQDREGDNIKRAEESIRFRAGEQWPQAIKQDREDPNQDGGSRPCPVMDKTNQYLRQIINEERQSRAAIKIRPVDDKADKVVAEKYNGIIRHIEDQSEAIESYITGGEHAIDGGFGYWRLYTEYSDHMSFEQDIIIKRIPNRFSVALGYHTEPDGSDAKEGLIWEEVSEDEFKEEYPKAKTEGFDKGDSWRSKDSIRVAEYMYINPEKETIHLLEDKTVVLEKDLNGQTPIATRETIIKTVKWIKLTSEEILDRKDMIGSYIPIVKVIGNELCMPDGKIRLSGALESMMDPQREHNYAHAGFIENVALAPKAPWVAEEFQIEDYEEEYTQANRKNIAVLKYKSSHDDSGQALPPPQRTPPAGIPIGWDRLLQNTEHGIEGAVGMYGASVGARSTERSGIALQEQKTQGMVGNYHFPDNLAKSIQHTGRILLEWIPAIYDTERVARILGEDGQQEMVYLDPNQEQAVMPRLDQMGQQVGSIYNLGIGKYDVTVTTGPSYTAKRQEAAENQLQLIQARPDMLDRMGDVYFNNVDWPGAEKIADRFSAMLPPEIKEMENKDSPVDPKIQAMMAQIKQTQLIMQEKEQQLMQVEQELKGRVQEHMGEKTELNALKKEHDANRRIFESEVRMKEAELEANANKIIEEIKETLEPDPKIIIEQQKIKLDKEKHDREMDLKEYQAKMDKDESGETVEKEDHHLEAMVGVVECLAGIDKKFNNIEERIESDQEIIVNRGDDGEIKSITKVKK